MENPAATLPPLRWGILATGRIAGVFASGLRSARAGRLVAVGSRSAESARRFAAEHGIAAANTHGTYEGLLADPDVEAVYISTPHPQHAEWVVKAAAAGKHILCEKPLGLNHAEAVAMVGAARRAGVVLMEAFMYRCHPQTAKIVSLIRDGALGTVGLVQANFSFRTEYQADSRLWANAAGGGGILDVGCYTVSMSRLVAGAAAGRAFLDPVEVSGAGVLHPESGVDVYAAATLKFPNGVIAQVAAGVGLSLENVVRIYGSAGWLLCRRLGSSTVRAGASKIILHRAGAAALRAGLVRGSVHQYVGQEAIAAGVCAHLRLTDYIASNHRGHGHAIAKGVDPLAMALELLGRAGGICGGKGGSMHIADFSKGMLGANGVVPDGVSIAVGAAQAIKMLRQDRIAVAFFGDGALNRGPLMEAFNWAKVYGLPILFVCEDNLYSVTQRTQEVTAGPGGTARAQAFGLPTEQADGNDLIEVIAAAGRLIAAIRAGGGPGFLYATTYRWYGHFAHDQGLYRDPAEIARWRERDCIPRTEAWLTGQGVLPKVLLAARAQARQAIEKAFAMAAAAPFPAAGEAFTDVQDVGAPR